MIKKCIICIWQKKTVALWMFFGLKRGWLCKHIENGAQINTCSPNQSQIESKIKPERTSKEIVVVLVASFWGRVCVAIDVLISMFFVFNARGENAAQFSRTNIHTFMDQMLITFCFKNTPQINAKIYTKNVTKNEQICSKRDPNMFPTASPKFTYWRKLIILWKLVFLIYTIKLSVLHALTQWVGGCREALLRRETFHLRKNTSLRGNRPTPRAKHQPPERRRRITWGIILIISSTLFSVWFLVRFLIDFWIQFWGTFSVCCILSTMFFSSNVLYSLGLEFNVIIGSFAPQGIR